MSLEPAAQAPCGSRPPAKSYPQAGRPLTLVLPLLLPLLVLAGCGEDQPPTAPTPPAEQGSQASSHTAGHKVVTSLADPGDGTCTAAQCTLREAINDPASSEISFAPGLTGPITLARSGAGGGTLVIDKTLAITGPGTGVTIRRLSTDPAFRILRIGSGATVKLTNLTIRNGKTDRPGGGIINVGTLALIHCTVADNSAPDGGGIKNRGTLTLTNTRVTRNSASFFGGGINNGPAGPGLGPFGVGTLTITNSTIANNSATWAGGGITNAGTFVLTNTDVANNLGGGIGNFGGTSTLTSARIVGNSYAGTGALRHGGGGITSGGGSVRLANSTVARNSSTDLGGGIFNGDGGTVTITNSTIANNSAAAGGGIANVVDLFDEHEVRTMLSNSTVSGNSAGGSGGGILNESRDFHPLAIVTLTNSTVAFNTAGRGGGIAIEDPFEAFLRLTNSLVARNNAANIPDVGPAVDISGTVRFSLIGDGTGSGITNTDGNQVGNVPPNTSPIDPRLGPLADNGGPTRTHALLLGSPALDAASTPDCPTTDQRGVLRPQGAACDIGSYERE